MNDMNKQWLNYGKWRQSPFPTVSVHLLTKELIEKYDLPDLKVVSVDQMAYSQEPVKIGVEYPGRGTRE